MKTLTNRALIAAAILAAAAFIVGYGQQPQGSGGKAEWKGAWRFLRLAFTQVFFGILLFN